MTDSTTESKVLKNEMLFSFGHQCVHKTDINHLTNSDNYNDVLASRYIVGSS